LRNSELARAVNGYKEMQFAFLGSHLSKVDVENSRWGSA
jgi:hypothetical protein